LSGASIRRAKRESALATSKKERVPEMSRNSSLSGTIMVSEFRHIIRLAAGTDGFLADALELFATVIATVVLPLYPLVEIQVPGGASANSTHVRSPHYDISMQRLKAIFFRHQHIRHSRNARHLNVGALNEDDVESHECDDQENAGVLDSRGYGRLPHLPGDQAGEERLHEAGMVQDSGKGCERD